MQNWEGNMTECEKKINAHRVAVRGILQTLANLEKEVKDTKTARDNAVRSEIARIRQQVPTASPLIGCVVPNFTSVVQFRQVAEKLKQVQGLLIKAHSQSVKDDRFTKIIKSFIASF